MRHAIFALPLLAGFTAFAQTQSATLPLERPAVTQDSCPLSMSARHVSMGQTYWAIAKEDRSPGTEAELRISPSGLHFELKVVSGAPIRKIELAVHYRLPSERPILVGQPDPAGKELIKTYTLTAAKGGELHLKGDLLVGQVAIITHLTVRSIEFADDTKWQPSAHGSCSVAPSPFVLVATR